MQLDKSACPAVNKSANPLSGQLSMYYL